MNIEFISADPAGNISLLVKTPVPPDKYSIVAQKLLNMRELRGEQVGFLTQPRMGGAVRLEMMGGEFCGNATRCAALYRARERGQDGLVPTEISGCSSVLPVWVEGEDVRLSMPLPLGIRTIPLWGARLPLVEFEGISHLILMGRKPREGDVEEVCRLFPQAPALGLMFYDGERLQPVVYVRATNSLFYENSCASGSTALAACLAEGMPDGQYSYVFYQPGGCIGVQARREGGKTAEIRIGGPVSLSPVMRAEI